jgi:predicted HicB family RNase H-like nuclease
MIVEIVDIVVLSWYIGIMAQKSQQKGGQPQKMKTLLIAIPEDLHTAMKIRAAEQKTTVKGYVTEAIRQAVEKGGERKR